MKQTFSVGMVPSKKDKYFDDIKNALVEKGIVEENTPDDILPTAIEEGVNALKDQIVPTWENIDLSTKKKLIYKKYDVSIICSNNIDCYGSISYYTDSTNQGIYYLNLLTGEETKIHNKYASAFFETSNGNVFAGLWSGDNGIALISGTTLSKIHTTGIGWDNWFEASNGYVYVSTQQNGEQGIVCINGTTATKIYTSGYEWKYFFEASNGYVYVGSTNSSSYSKGLIVLNETTATQILANYWYWTNFYETKNNNVYVFGHGTASTGVYHLSGTTATQVINNNWNIYYENSKGDLYVAMSSSYGVKIIDGKSISNVLLNGSTISGNNWDTFFEDSKGKTYVSSSTNSAGLLNLSGTIATQITSDYRGYEKLYEAFNGKVYCLAHQPSTSTKPTTYYLFVINDLSSSLVYVSDSEYKYLTERTEGIIASKTEYPNGQDFLLIDKETNQVYLMKE